ncbi:hypothetical protein B0T17DRAFT_218452 [Bombardia bombarda]|uniref:Uncharacterized protein n=1 Tax=Bombardia bombarda TaxID=252184 RepID=A0AA39XBQ5_9PEZI|nr:hypothetical protein B0T17DRAFT_218452 [Bombardia bombarda]
MRGEHLEAADSLQKYPSLDIATQTAISAEYQALHQLVQEKGLYDCPYSEYGKEMARYTALFCIFLWLLHVQWYKTSALFLGMFWQQIMFTAHDAGHRGITGNFIIDTVIAYVVSYWHVYSQPWPRRVLCLAPDPNHHGRRLP